MEGNGSLVDAFTKAQRPFKAQTPIGGDNASSPAKGRKRQTPDGLGDIPRSLWLLLVPVRRLLRFQSHWEEG